MKVVHVIKRVETIDNDIKELRKLEKSLSRDKSFSTPIYMTIEKQINILLGERIKLLDLRIANPPDSFTGEMEEDIQEQPEEILPSIPEPKKPAKKTKAKVKAKEKPKPADIFSDDDEIPMLTQDQIDAKFDAMKSEKKPEPEIVKHEKINFESETENSRDSDFDEEPEEKEYDDTSIKLLDIALEKGSLNQKTAEKEKKVKFFRENFPSS